MTPALDGSLAAAVAALARVDLAGWRGLPAGLSCAPVADDEAPAEALLGDDAQPADMVYLPDPSPGAAARAWLRDDVVVLIDVARTHDAAPVSVPDALGEPDARLDIAYGLVTVPGGEWLYASRGLSLVVQSGLVRHVMGFAPCGVAAYVRALRIGFGTRRLPLRGGVEEGL